MPSGFQQDLDQLQSEAYRITIDMANTTYFPSASATTTDNGGVSPNSFDSFTSANLPTTLASSTYRAQGNMRFRNIVNRLSGLSDVQILDITITEANADAQATSLAFTARFDRPAFIPLTGSYQGSTVVGNDIAGNAMDTTAKAVANAVAQGIRDTTKASMRVYNPTNDGGQASINVTTTGMTAAQTLGKVTVTRLTESTLAG